MAGEFSEGSSFGNDSSVSQEGEQGLYQPETLKNAKVVYVDPDASGAMVDSLRSTPDHNIVYTDVLDGSDAGDRSEGDDDYEGYGEEDH